MVWVSSQLFGIQTDSPLCLPLKYNGRISLWHELGSRISGSRVTQNSKKTHTDQGKCLDKRPYDKQIVRPSPGCILIDKPSKGHKNGELRSAFVSPTEKRSDFRAKKLHHGINSHRTNEGVYLSASKPNPGTEKRTFRQFYSGTYRRHYHHQR
jgi:hypothetical protein